MSEQDILQKHLAPFLASQFFHTITNEDILKKTDLGWTHKGVVLSPGQVEVLKKEAIQFARTKLYPILKDELQFFAKQSLDKAQTETDIINAKLLSYFVDVIESKLKKIAEM